MSVSTDKLIPGVLPPKDEQEGIDFLAILDGFDPSKLSKEVLDVFASRNSFVTEKESEIRYYEYEGVTSLVPNYPAERRLGLGKIVADDDRENLISQVAKYRAEVPNAYKNCRRDLIKAIGSKTCLYIVEKEVESLSPEQLSKQKEDYDRWEKYCEYERQNRDYEEDYDYYDLVASVSEKVVLVRKGIRKRDGRYFTQRDFAKLIDYPIAKYAAAEKNDDMVDDVLLEKLIMICHANPYFLYDDACDAFMGEYDSIAAKVGDAPAIIVGLDVIYKWIQDGRPREVDWFEGVLS